MSASTARPSRDDDVAVLVAAEDRRVDARQRPAHRARANVGRREVRDHDPAGLGLPPVVVDRETERLDSPQHGLGVERLADARDEAQRGEVVLAGGHVGRPHHHANGGGRGVPDVHALAFEGRVPAGRVELRLVDDERRADRRGAR